MSRQLTAIRHLDSGTLQGLVDRAVEFKSLKEAGLPTTASAPRTIGLLFFENSTRTRVSFEQACNYLGFTHVNFSGAGSSISKGESLKDTILTLKNEHLEGLVMRHRCSGSYVTATKHYSGPFVNAGDGQHEHPTQALGDAMTILERTGTLSGLTVTIVGDVLHSRVARSNAWLLSKMGSNIRFVGPRSLMPSYSNLLPGQVFYDLRAGLEGADVVMCLRLQTERMEEGRLSSIGEFSKMYQINRQSLKVASPNAIVMHPGPMNRGVEIDDWTADGGQSVIQTQVSNSVFVRMAALEWVFGEDAE